MEQGTEVKVQQVKTVGVGEYCRALILHAVKEGKNLNNEELAAKVVAKFKEHNVEVKTSAACIAWYKNDLRKKGLLQGGTQGKKAAQINLEEISLD